jgi:hypothetical protein
VTVYKGIPVTTIARMLVDLTDVLGPYDLANVIHEAEYRQRFHEPATRAAMRRANGRHNLKRLERALERRRTKLNGEEADFHWPAHKLAVSALRLQGLLQPRTWGAA